MNKVRPSAVRSGEAQGSGLRRSGGAHCAAPLARRGLEYAVVLTGGGPKPNELEDALAVVDVPKVEEHIRVECKVGVVVLNAPIVASHNGDIGDDHAHDERVKRHRRNNVEEEEAAKVGGWARRLLGLGVSGVLHRVHPLLLLGRHRRGTAVVVLVLQLIELVDDHACRKKKKAKRAQRREVRKA